jgi:uncharacterized protein YwqG
MDNTRKPTRRNVLQRGGGLGALTLFGQFAMSIRSYAMATQGPFRTLEELGASLASAGISASNQRILLALARPAIALGSKAAEDKDIAIGVSKIGGAPDVPPGFTWPTRGPVKDDGHLKALQDIIAQRKSRTFGGGDRTEQQYLDGIALTEREFNAKSKLYKSEAPLTFLMQLDLAELVALGPIDPDYPREGRLLVFYDMIVRPWFARDAENHPSFQVIHDMTPKSELERRSAPDPGYPLLEFTKDDPRDFSFLRNHMPAARIVPVFTYTLPDNYTQPMFSRSYALGLDVPQMKWSADTPAHLDASNRLFGWPELIQNDMSIELAARDLKQDLPALSVAAYSAAVERLAPEADKWVLLLQIGDYDNNVWDLDGLYYIWIKRLDLMARNFSKAEMIYQTD